MSKKIHKLKIVAYEKDGSLFAEHIMYDYSYDRLYQVYMEYVQLLVQGKFTYIYRLDLVSGTRILFSCCALRSFVDQKNLTINFNPY